LWRPRPRTSFLTISDVIASFVLYEFEGEVVISARSMGALNVQLIMEKLGGGGHLTMAGVQLPGAVLADVKKALTAAIDELLDNRATAH
jgi:c-di-AMP phosphodiesterase-like protein